MSRLGANETYTSIVFSYQPAATSRGDRWTASIGDYDGSGDSREGALFELVNSMHMRIKELESR